MSIFLRYIVILSVVIPVWAGASQPIIVSAPRLDDLDLMSVDTAADVTVIDRDIIEQSGASSVPELLQNEANVLIRSTTGTGLDGQISMRGFGDNSHLRTLVLVDGHKLTRPDMGGVNWQSIPVSNVEKIEVIRGGQNVLYGDRAVGGVVKITTKRGADAGTKFGGSIGSFETISGSMSHGDAVGDFDYYIGVDGYESDGFRSNSTSRATTVSGSLAWYGDTDIITLRSSFTKSHIQFPGPLEYEQMHEDPTQSNYLGSDNSDMKSSLSTLIWETKQDWGAARVTSGLDIRETDWELRGQFAQNSILGASFGPRIRFGNETNFFMTGLDLNYDTLDFDNLHPEDTRYRQTWAKMERLTVSPYIFAQKTLSTRYTLNGGVRYEHARSNFRHVDYVDNQILHFENLLGFGRIPNDLHKSPPDIDPDKSYSGITKKQGWATEISLAYDLSKNWSTWAGYDRLYRYPTVDEAAAYQGYDLSEQLNENLDPEAGDEFELGLRYKAQSWRAILSTYYMMMDNEIVFDDEANLNRNLGSTRRFGTDVELALNKKWYGANTRWTFQEALLHGGENNSNRVPLVPWMHGVFTAWVDPAEQIRLTMSWLYVSDQYHGNDEENKKELDAYGLLGLRINIDITPYARYEFAVNNLLDQTYATTAYSEAYYPGTGRNFRTGLTMEF